MTLLILLGLYHVLVRSKNQGRCGSCWVRTRPHCHKRALHQRCKRAAHPFAMCAFWGWPPAGLFEHRRNRRFFRNSDGHARLVLRRRTCRMRAHRPRLPRWADGPRLCMGRKKRRALLRVFLPLHERHWPSWPVPVHLQLSGHCHGVHATASRGQSTPARGPSASMCAIKSPCATPFARTTPTSHKAMRTS